MNQTMTVLQQFAAAHPIYYGIGAMAVGVAAPKLVGWAKTSGVDYVVGKWRTFQRARMKAAGMSDEQIVAAEKDEAEALRRAADDLENPYQDPTQQPPAK